MSISRKFNITIFVLSSFLLATVLVVFRVWVYLGYTKVEENMATKNLDRVAQAQAQMMGNLAIKLNDWVWWDDSYNFLLKPNDEYRESNITKVGLEGLRIVGMMFLDVDTNVIETIGRTPSFNKELLFSLEDNGELSGLIEDGEGVVAYMVKPVLSSTKSGPRAGYIAFFQDYNIQVDLMEEVLQLSIKFEKEAKTFDGEESIDFENEHEIIGHRSLHDYRGDRIGYLHFTMPREISAQGSKSISRVLLALIAVVSFNTVIYYLILRGLVINRLLKVSNEVQKVGEDVGRNRVSELSGDDELSNLSKKINEMLLNLQSKSELAKTGTENVRSYIDIVGVMVVAIGIDEKVILINKKAGEILRVESSEVIGENWFESFIPDEIRTDIRGIFTKVVNGASDVEYQENWVQTKNGDRRMIAWHNTTIKDEQGKVIASLSAGEDVTDRKLAEQEREKHAQEIEQLNELMVGREMKMMELKRKFKEKRGLHGK